MDPAPPINLRGSVAQGVAHDGCHREEPGRSQHGEAAGDIFLEGAGEASRTVLQLHREDNFTIPCVASGAGAERAAAYLVGSLAAARRTAASLTLPVLSLILPSVVFGEN